MFYFSLGTIVSPKRIRVLWYFPNIYHVVLRRPDTLDPALTRPGRLDRKVEFSLPDLEVCVFCFVLFVVVGVVLFYVCSVV